MSAEDRQDLGTYDYIIVGAGSAGCVLANRLSRDPEASLLEAGGRDDYFWIHVPIGYLFCMNNPRTDWCMSTEAEDGLNGRALSYPRGKVLGGCSSINGMIYMRGQARDYDQWRQLGNPGWGWDDVLPYFKRSEDSHRGETDLHGAGGEWRVETQRLSCKILDAFRDAAEEVGIPPTDDFNGGTNEGSATRSTSGAATLEHREGVPGTGRKTSQPAGSDQGPYPGLIIMGAAPRRRLRSERDARACVRSRRGILAAGRQSPQILNFRIGDPEVWAVSAFPSVTRCPG